MEKEPYNIDEILSEVKKRHEEQERAQREETEKAEQKAVKSEPEQKEIKDAVQEEKKTKPEKRETPEINEKLTEEKAEKAPEPVFKDTATEEQKPETQEKEDEMVDLLKFSSEESSEEKEEEEEEKVKFFKTKKGKIIKIVIIVLLILVIAAGVGAAVYINKIANRVTDDEPEEYEAVTYYDGMDFLQEDFPIIEEQSGYDIYSYKQYLKDWYMNGDPVRSSHVLNVLLIGEDTRAEEISDASRADSAIIASVNIDTGTIHLTSILRDLYVYYEVNGEGRYGKINESASVGGIKTYIETVQRTYKIAIDSYAIVNFASFPKIIDALGGVDISITDAEINEINNNPNRYDDVGDVYIEKTFEGSEGVMTLDGLQALAFCRIRKLDSDNARADRQKTVISEILSKMKTAGTVDTVKVVNQLSQYVKTSYSKKEIIALGNTALRDGWLNYEIQSSNVPAEENCEGGENFSASPNNWIWIADIPKDAYELQIQIYGKSNIKLNDNRADYIALGR